MKTPIPNRPSPGLSLFALTLALLCPATAAQAAVSPAPGNSTNANPAAAIAASVPQSVFIVPTSPRQGRNPFFPRSTFNASPTEAKAETFDPSAVVLNGLTSPPRLTAMINGRTFEPGESGQIKLPNGTRIHVQCVEIRPDAVVAIIGAERRELRLRHGH